MIEHGQYSVKNAERFGWSSITGSLHPERVAHLQQHLRGKTVLDAGCGGGAYVEYLAKSGWEATGLERSEQFLTFARSTDAKGQYLQGDITDIPFDDGHFDSVYCYDVIEHVEMESRAVSELCRVAKERLILAVPAHDENVIGHGLTYSHYQDLTHCRTYTQESLAAALLQAGQAKFTIQPELPVDLRGLAIEHLSDPASSSTHGSMLSFIKRKGLNLLLRRLLARARYQTFCSGWVAVVDIA